MNNMTELISWFQSEYPDFVADMKSSDHHRTRMDELLEGSGKVQGSVIAPINLNPYHIEGDIWTHTMLVCKQAENAPYEVKLAALLHDIGKPATRAVNPKNGRVSFYNHDAVGAFMSLEILKRPELGLSKEQQIMVFNLIALHTQIYKLSEQQLADIGDLELIRLLRLLGKADHEGRFHTAGDAEIPYLINIQTKIKPKRNVKELEKEVVVLVGPPASGKSTWIKKQCMKDGKFGTYIISRDYHIDNNAEGKDYNEKWRNVNQNFVDKLVQEDFKLCQDYNSVVVDMTHMSKKSRRRTLSHFDDSFKKKAVVFLTDLQKMHLQNEARDGKIIDRKVIDKMIRSFYPPTLEEFDEIEYVIV